MAPKGITWPDGGATPFKGEKATNWEGGFRVPCLIRWPGVIKPGTIVNDICAHEDFIPTFAAAAGDPDLVEKVLKGTTLNGKNFKVHLDGMNLLPFLKGDAKESPRKEFLYWSDDGDLMAHPLSRLEGHLPGAEHGDIAKNSTGRLVRASSRICACPRFTTCAPIRSSAGRKASYYADWFAHRIVHPCAGAGLGRAAAGELQGVSAARQGGELHRQRRDGEDRTASANKN